MIKVVSIVTVRKEDLYRMLDSLSNEDKKAAFDFIEFLVERSKSKKPQYWQDIDELDSDEEPLTDEEQKQLESEEGYISGEDAKREFGLQVDLP
jgi:hypothetical protein